MRPEETGINNNYWRPGNGREIGQATQNHVNPISGPGIPETVFKVAKEQNKNIKVTQNVYLQYDIACILQGPRHGFESGFS